MLLQQHAFRVPDLGRASGEEEIDWAGQWKSRERIQKGRTCCKQGMLFLPDRCTKLLQGLQRHCPNRGWGETISAHPLVFSLLIRLLQLILLLHFGKAKGCEGVVSAPVVTEHTIDYSK